MKKAGLNKFKMKRILFIVSILGMLLTGTASGAGISKAKITAFLYECQQYEGVELVQMGRMATLALRGAIKLGSIDDPDAREAVKLISGIKRISVLEYEDCEPEIREKITRKLDRMLKESDLLMETRDGNDRMQIYGVVDEKSGTVRDFVLHTPADYSLVCIFGSIPIEKMAKIAMQND